MPNRLIHESICTSDTIEQLSPEEEVFFYRLLVQCDDFGRFDARPPVLLARCFPLRIGRVKESHVKTWLAKLQSAGLLWIYEVDSHIYLQITKWNRYQQGRAIKSKYPEPPTDESGHPISIEINGYQAKSDSPVSVSVSVSDSISRLPRVKSVAVETPEELREFDSILREWPTYIPSARFYAEVLESYGHLHLKAEAVKISEWLKEHRKRRCSTTFVLNWLQNAAARHDARGGGNNRYQPEPNRPPPVSEVCKW